MSRKAKTHDPCGVVEGAFKATRRSGWRYCLVGVDDRSITCEFADGRRRSIPIGKIFDVSIEQQKMGPGHKPVLVIGYETDSGPGRKIWLNLEDPFDWKETIIDLRLPPVDTEDILDVAGTLPPETADLLTYLWERGHATIDELVEVTGASSHMEVIVVLKKEINPALEKTLGKPLIEFISSRRDPVIHETVRNSWWLSGRRPIEELPHPGSIDVFDEGGYVRVVIEPVSITGDELNIGLDGDRLVVSLGGGNGEEKDIPLPPEFSWGDISYSLNNGVLDINVGKVQPH
jgi:hypothetical protein